jgi:hypothetical protein
MKASSLWPGTHYAYQEYLGRGRALPLDARRIVVLDLVSTPIPGGKKSRTEALVMFMDEDGGAITEGRDSEPRHVKAPDIINFWEDYEVERDARREEKRIEDEKRAAQQAQWRKEREERQAITAVASFIYYAAESMRRWEREKAIREQQEMEAAKARRIKNVLITRGLTREAIIVNNGSIILQRDDVERWLGISD